MVQTPHWLLWIQGEEGGSAATVRYQAPADHTRVQGRQDCSAGSKGIVKSSLPVVSILLQTLWDMLQTGKNCAVIRNVEPGLVAPCAHNTPSA